MTSLSIICAPPYGRNPGMASVDLAFPEIARIVDATDVTYWRLWDQSEILDVAGGSWSIGDDGWYDPDTELEYRNLRGQLDEALEADGIVYWGDFLHLARARYETAKLLHGELGRSATYTEAEASAARYLLLDGQSDRVLARTASFGTTLAMNAPGDYAGTYGEQLQSFVGRVGAIGMRDSYSARVVRQLRKEWDKSFEAVDGGFLLAPSPPVETRSGVGVFFGRSKLRPETLARFGQAFARRLDEVPVWIDWGRDPGLWPIGGRRRFRAAWPSLEHQTLRRPSVKALSSTYREVLAGKRILDDGASPPASDLFDQLGGCKAVVTDTYHLALNAWRVGTPAVCVLDTPDANWSVNSGSPDNARDKRRELYSMLDALPFIVDAPTSGRAIAKEAERTAALVGDDAAVEGVRRRVRALTEQGLAVVTDGIRSLLTG